MTGAKIVRERCQCGGEIIDDDLTGERRCRGCGMRPAVTPLAPEPWTERDVRPDLPHVIERRYEIADGFNGGVSVGGERPSAISPEGLPVFVRWNSVGSVSLADGEKFHAMLGAAIDYGKRVAAELAKEGVK